MIQSFHRVAQYFFGLRHSQFTADNLYTVTHLQLQVGSGDKVYSRTVYTRDTDSKIITDFKLCQSLSVQLRLGNQNLSGNQVLILKIPFHIYLFAKENGNCLHVYRVGNDKNFIIQMKDCI